MIRYDSDTETFFLTDPTEDEIQELDAKLKRISPGELRWYPPGITGPPEGWRGMGDVIKAAAEYAGFRQCGGCKKRQEFFNKLVPNPFHKEST